MGTCYNCNSEITLKDEETRCDSCGKIVRYWCQNCKQPFDVEKENKDKIKECLTCGFFVCPNCGECGEYCQKKEWIQTIKKIFSPEINYLSVPNLEEKLKKIIQYIEEIKIGKVQTTCPLGVPKSYAKNRIKLCLARMEGYAAKNTQDIINFKERLKHIEDMPIDYKFTISQEKEEGSYGQELRDVCNFCICSGELKVEEIKDKEDNKGLLWTRINNPPCPNLEKGDVTFKKCNKCNKKFSKELDYCPECIISKGPNKGKSPILILKTTNKDVCQLNRGLFEKRGEESE